MSIRHKKSHALKFTIRRELIITSALATIALLLIFFGPHNQTDNVFASSEVQFADASAKGLAIVPASCPSDPAWSSQDAGWVQRHGPGECDVPPSPPPPGACNITAENTTVDSGQNTNLLWNTYPGNPDHPACPIYTVCYGALQSVTLSKDGTQIDSGLSRAGSKNVTVGATSNYQLTATYELYGAYQGTAAAQCDVTITVGAGPYSCALTASSYHIARGQSTTLIWRYAPPNPFTAHLLSYEIDNGIGDVPRDGSRDVSPNVTTTYTYTVYQPTLWGGRVPATTCNNTIYVDGGAQCPDGTPAPNNDPSQCPGGPRCSDGTPAPSGDVTKCPGGEPRFSCTSGTNQCVLDPYGPYSDSSCDGGCGKCPEGQVWLPPQQGNGASGRCEPIECPPGTILQGSRCVRVSCPQGQVPGYDGVCRCPGGSANCSQCTERYYCAGNDLRHVDTQCVDTFVRQCYAGCSNNACLAFPAPDADLTAKPALLRRFDTTVVSWTARNVISCTVTGSNGDGTGQNATGEWTGISGTKTSSPIEGRTTYRLTCQGRDNSTLSKAVEVNIIPEWQEQ